MPTLDQLLAEGKKVLEGKKRGRPRKDSRPPAKPTADKLLTAKVYQASGRKTILTGQWNVAGLTISYTKHICKRCKRSDISAYPDHFLTQVDSRNPLTKRHIRLSDPGTIQNLVNQFPVKTELHPVETPYCRECFRKELTNASGTQGLNPHNLPNPAEAVQPAEPPQARAIPGGSAEPLQAWRPYQIHLLPHPPRLAPVY